MQIFRKIYFRRRNAFAVAIFAFFLIFGGLSQGESVSDRLMVSTTIPQWMEYNIIKDQTEVKISNNDIRKGFKDILSGTIVSVSSNSKNGYILNLSCSADTPFASIVVTTESGSFTLFPGGSMNIYIPSSGQINQNLKLDYTLLLSETMKSGVLPWPIEIMAHLL